MPFKFTALLRAILAGSGGVASPSFTVLFEPLTNSTGTVTTRAYINAAEGSGDITPSISASRITGVAPLYVMFDASATTATTLTSKPFHELQYDWTFGDSGAGSWTKGAKARFSIASPKNTDAGPIAAHVFETPGEYIVTMTGRYDTTTSAPETVTITVSDPNTVFSGANTICIANGTLPVEGVNGVPTGATCVNTSSVATINSHIAAGKRVWLKRGDTWTGTTALTINAAGPGIVGAYGTGAKPKLVGTAIMDMIAFGAYDQVVCNDWRVMDLELDGGDYPNNSHGVAYLGTADRMTLCRVDISRTEVGIHGSWEVLSDTKTLHQESCFYECNITDIAGTYPTDDGGNGAYVAGHKLAILGCDVDPNFGGEHGIRTSYSDKFVYSHNEFANIVDEKAYLSIRAPVMDGIIDPFLDQYLIGGEIYTQYGFVSDNYLDARPNPANGSSMGCGGINQDHGDGIARNIIFDSNFLYEGRITIYGNTNTVRNNIYINTTTLGTPFQTEHTIRQPDVTDIVFANNSVYRTHTNDADFMVVGGANMPGATVIGYNNLMYAPNSSSWDDAEMWKMVLITGITFTLSDNTTNAQTLVVPYTTVPPAVPVDFTPKVATYAVGTGATVPVWADFFGSQITNANRTLGAVKAA